MSNRLFAFALFFSGALLTSESVPAALGPRTEGDTEGDAEPYQCEIYCSDEVLTGPGSCPSCELPLRTVRSVRDKLRLGRTAAVLLFPGVQVIDFSGPFEVLGAAGFRVVTVSRTKGTLRTDEGLALVPDYTLATCPAVDVLVLPGGKLYPDDETVAWIRDVFARAELVLSVCNGLGWLDAAGLVDDLEVTTTATSIPRLSGDELKCRLVPGRRVVDAGRIITSGGYTSGIDGALQVVARVKGRGAAELLATKLEYDWAPDRGMFPRRASYYMHLRPILRSLERGATVLRDAEISSASCGADRAEVTWEVSGETPTALSAELDAAFARLSAWAREPTSDGRWMTSGPDAWSAQAEVTCDDGRTLVRLVLLGPER